MSFLQPMLLWALPLLALPIVIHLINQWRYQTKPWAPMMFLLQANRMNRGFARVRQWLILAMRTLAIAGLIFAISRPLASGFWGVWGSGQTDTTLVIMDRSPSMNWQGQGSESKLSTGKRQLSDALGTLGSAHWVSIDSASGSAREHSTLAALLESNAMDGCSAAAQVPQALANALEYLQINKPGAAEVWLCSDLQSSDWQVDSGDWNLLRQGFAALPQSVRFRLLAFPETSNDNLSIRVTDARRDVVTQGSQTKNQLVLSLQVLSSNDQSTKRTVPVQLELEGVRSELSIELDGGSGQLRDYRLDLPAKMESGWGRVSIPADANNADNQYFFVFAATPVQRVVIVADDMLAVRPLHIAASLSPDGSADSQLELLSSAQVQSTALAGAALLIWQSDLPEGDAASAVDQYVASGGQVLFFPPSGLSKGRVATASRYRGVRWNGWKSQSQTPVMVVNWRGDQDLLGSTQSGAGLPVGQLSIRSYATLASEQSLSHLATLDGGDSLLARLPTTSGGIYFCAAGTQPSQSSLAENGVVLFVVVQRSIQQGQASLSSWQMRTASAQRKQGGDATDLQPTSTWSDPAVWQQLAGQSGLSSEFDCHAGVYRSQDRLFAVNRPASEDMASMVSDQQLSELFAGLSLDRVDQTAGRLGGILREIWRVMLILMLIALLLEAVLCLPGRRSSPVASRSFWEPTAK
jgi:hypothetical protein